MFQRKSSGKRGKSALEAAADEKRKGRQQAPASKSGLSTDIKSSSTRRQQKGVVVGSANSHFEREADQVADRVMARQQAVLNPITPVGHSQASRTEDEVQQKAQAKVQRAEEEEAQTKVQRAEEEGAQPQAQRAEDEEAQTKVQRAEEEEVQTKVQRAEEEEAQPQVQRAEEEAVQAREQAETQMHYSVERVRPSSDFMSAIDASKASGQTLPEAILGEMNTHFRADFSGIRIHEGPTADMLARDINAIAFTLGGHIYFRAGAFEPQTQKGKHLLIHELTHTIQQGAVVQAGAMTNEHANFGGMVLVTRHAVEDMEEDDEPEQQ
ncbi:Uncharacterised protein [BD1-7 clade bacterium]|uniref:eCIS core domain-containing protein n=1 Tax=BD1-7 clade bacterium TaxID=2029982 RepID=A0A5S9QMD4_9GAMM|nr:Uncharacterised protein [BD1-7 clade bacterium]